MDRAEAIKRLEWLRMVGNHVDSVTLGSEDMGYFDIAISALREQEQSKWISVKERVPEDNKEVLIYCGSYHEIGWYDSDNKSWRSDFLGCCTDDVTHWMPMPEPPKGE